MNSGVGLDMFKTPSPSRRTKRTPSSKDRCNRVRTPCTPDQSLNEEDQHQTVTPLSRPKCDIKRAGLCASWSVPRTKRNRSFTDNISEKFRREMPLSARKAKPAQLPPSSRDFLPIRQSSFYGTKTKSPSASFTSTDSSSASTSKTSPIITNGIGANGQQSSPALPSQRWDAMSKKSQISMPKSKIDGKLRF